MNLSNRARLTTLALLVWTQACTVYRPPPANAPLLVRRTVRIRSAEPFALGLPAFAEAPVTVVCHATAVGGEVLRMTGDTLMLGRSRDIVSASEPDGSSRRCPENLSVAIVVTPTMEVTEQRVDAGRTTALILGIVAAVLGFAAYAASNISPGFPSGTGTY